MRTYLVKGATKLTGDFEVGGYVFLGTLNDDGSFHCRSGATFVLDPDNLVMVTKNRTTSAADGNWGGRIGMVNINSLGKLGYDIRGGDTKHVYRGRTDILNRFPTLKNASAKDKARVDRAFSRMKERYSASAA